MKMIEKGDHIEAAPLLVDDDENNPQERMTLRSIFTMFKYYRFETPWFRCGGIGVLLLVQTILLGLTITTTLLWAHYTQQRRDLVYSPAQEQVRFYKQRFDAELVVESEFIGDPTPESDVAWRDLLQNMNIAVSASELDRIGASSIEVPDRPGMYIAGLSVYHELHCLKRLRQYTWLDHYFPNQTSEEARLHRLHTDHCIDVLRQAILCHADVSLFTLQWSQAETMPRADFSNEHQCTDWKRLDAWAAERAIPDETMKTLKHPLHGPAFPDGKGSLLGASEDHSPTVHEHGHEHR